MKKFYFATVMSAIVFLVSGCVSLDAYKKIEPMSFEVNPPTENEFVTLIQDEQIAKAIIGDWVCQGTCHGFSKLDVNGKPFMYTNMPVQELEEIWSFTGDGKCSFRTKTSSVNPQTGAVSKTEAQQKGTWRCKNGEIILSLYNESLKRYITMTAVAVLSGSDTMEFRYNGDSYQKIIEQERGKAALPKGFNFDKSEFYYDDNGNMYVTMSLSGKRNGMTFVNNIITKQSRKLFKKLK